MKTSLSTSCFVIPPGMGTNIHSLQAQGPEGQDPGAAQAPGRARQAHVRTLLKRKLPNQNTGTIANSVSDSDELTREQGGEKN